MGACEDYDPHSAKWKSFAIVVSIGLGLLALALYLAYRGFFLAKSKLFF